MSFFDEVDSTGIVEEHIQAALELEHSQSQTILENYTDIRDELAARLAKVSSKAPQSFTAQHLRGVLAQVQGAITAINAKLEGAMVGGANEAALSGVEDLIEELKVLDEKFTGAVTPINLNAALFARDSTKYLVTKYKSDINQYGQGVMQQLQAGLLSASIGEVAYDDVTRRIKAFFEGEEWKLRRIVRTELHNIYNVGKLAGMQELASDEVPDLMKTLMHPMDQRTGADSKYAASLNLVAQIDEPFVYEWKGQLREFMHPPDRPNDRSILVPYRREWGAARGGAFIPGTFPEV